MGYKALRIVMASLMVASMAHAALTGSITISGNVPGATAIVVTSVAGYNNLDLSASPVDLQVANVREINNTANGYTVTLASTNAGLLKNGTVGQLAYTAKYNGSSVTLSSMPVQVTNAPPSTSVVNVLKPFTISYTGVPSEQLMAGTYTDTLTFTIAAN